MFQDNWSGRAEMGLAGDDDFHFKVSPDNSTWYEALKIARNGGAVGLPRGQLAFPGTQNSSTDPNTLDDYVEDTWTPLLQGGTTAGTADYSTQLGSYTKIGRLIFFYGRVTLTALSGAVGVAEIHGLPFWGSANQYPAATLAYYNGITLPTGRTQLVAFLNNGSPVIRLGVTGSGSAAGLLDVSGIAGDADIAFSGCYQAA